MKAYLLATCVATCTALPPLRARRKVAPARRAAGVVGGAAGLVGGGAAPAPLRGYASLAVAGGAAPAPLRGYASLAGGMLVHLVLGTLYCWGNFVSYVPPAMRRRRRRLAPGSPGDALIAGLVGAGIALAYTAPLVAGWSWFPDARGFVNGAVLMGFGAGGFFFNLLGTRLANPGGVPASGGAFPDEVYANFPVMLRKLALVYGAVVAVGRVVARGQRRRRGGGRGPDARAGHRAEPQLRRALRGDRALRVRGAHVRVGLQGLRDDARHGDGFLSGVGAVGALCNGLGRLAWGALAVRRAPRGPKRLVNKLTNRPRPPRWILDVEALPDAGDFGVVFVVDLTRGGAADDALKLLAPLARGAVAANATVDGAARDARPRPRLRAVVCGGDGTVGWVAGHLDAAAARDGAFVKPPLAVFPLGTGNDSRSAGGGGRRDLSSTRRRVGAAAPARLDRWAADVDGEAVPFLNYLGVGVDAEALYGVAALFRSSGGGGAPRGPLVAPLLDVAVDGEQIEVPATARAVVVANIDSYMGGGKLWYGDRGDDDGLVEGASAVVARSASLPAHVDGEPFRSRARAPSPWPGRAPDVLANDQERSGWKLDAFSRHLLALYDYERGIYAVDRPTPRIKARPKLF
ncbi:monocarboxylate transporter [Aureococcus anophagefferens]|nr:monocarboxylate transporter [Aureococcus anophagefferens]